MKIILQTALGKCFKKATDHAMQSNMNKEENPQPFFFFIFK